jgi:hypothetical protein
MTVLTVPYIVWKLDNSPATARFLTPQERLWAVERLRDNNTGIENSECFAILQNRGLNARKGHFKWYQAVEACVSPLLWLFVALTFCVKSVSRQCEDHTGLTQFSAVREVPWSMYCKSAMPCARSPY